MSQSSWPPGGSGPQPPPTGKGNLSGGSGWSGSSGTPGGSQGGSGWPGGGPPGPPAPQAPDSGWPGGRAGSAWPGQPAAPTPGASGWTGGGPASPSASGNSAWAGGGPTWTPQPGDSDIGDARPPMVWLWAAICGPIIGIVLLFLHGWTWNAVGWAVAVFVGLGLLVVFTTIDLRRRANPSYLARPGLVGALRIGVAAGAILVGGVHAWLLADYIAKLDVWSS